jgi:hypothetical protein
MPIFFAVVWEGRGEEVTCHKGQSGNNDDHDLSRATWDYPKKLRILIHV